MVNAPLRIPAPPHPAIALQTMNMKENLATPQMRDPTSKRRKALMKIILRQSVSEALVLDSAYLLLTCKTDIVYEK
jgi:hypothetical protein